MDLINLSTSTYRVFFPHSCVCNADRRDCCIITQANIRKQGSCRVSGPNRGEKEVMCEGRLVTSSAVRACGPIQISSGWNVPVGPAGPGRGAVPPDQIRTGAAGAVKQSERRPARPSCPGMRAGRGGLLSILPATSGASLTDCSGFAHS